MHVVQYMLNCMANIAVHACDGGQAQGTMLWVGKKSPLTWMQVRNAQCLNVPECPSIKPISPTVWLLVNLKICNLIDTQRCDKNYPREARTMSDWFPQKFLSALQQCKIRSWCSLHIIWTSYMSGNSEVAFFPSTFTESTLSQPPNAATSASSSSIIAFHLGSRFWPLCFSWNGSIMCIFICMHQQWGRESKQTMVNSLLPSHENLFSSLKCYACIDMQNRSCSSLNKRMSNR